MRNARSSHRVGLLSLTIIVAILCLGQRSFSQVLSSVEQKIVNHVRQHEQSAISFLEQVVNVNSGTMNHKGVRVVGKLFEGEFTALGFETRWVTMPDSVQRAGHLFARRQGNQGKRILLIGHLDTVYEPDSPFQRFERKDTVAKGPGTVDMKGGDVAILYALKTLHSVGALENTNIIVAFLGDEEKAGMPITVSRGDLEEAAKQSDIALGFEAAVRVGKTATVARRGSSQWKLQVTGVQAHSSGIFGSRVGSGAIFEASRILNAFHEQLRGEQYLTFNPGVIVGGTDVNYDAANSRGIAFGKTNVVAQTVFVEGDLRFISDEQKERARAKMIDIVSQNLPGTSATIRFDDAYPAMPPTPGNYDILKIFDQVSRDLGYGPVEALDPGARGAGDISFIASLVHGLDGLGVWGRGSHTIDEEIDLRSLKITMERTALFLYRLTRDE